MSEIAVITGGTSGIGRATARLFAQEGARIVVGARREAELLTLVDEITSAGGEAVALAGDVTDEHYARELVLLAQGRFGGLDIAFNNAGTIKVIGSASSAISPKMRPKSCTLVTASITMPPTKSVRPAATPMLPIHRC